MKVLLPVALLAITCITLCHSELINKSVERQSQIYKAQIHILYNLLQADCPDVVLEKRELLTDDLKPASLSVLTIHYQQLLREWVDCRAAKNGISTTTNTTSVTPLPTTASTSISSTSSSTTPPTSTIVPTTPTSCPSYDRAYTKFFLQFIRYENPSNLKATGVPCDDDGTACDISLEICVSAVGSNKCEYYQTTTDVLGESSQINFYNKLGSLDNRLEIDIGDQTWRGANIDISVWDTDSNKSHDLVDDFNYNFTGLPGSARRLITLDGVRSTEKSKLMVMLTVPCPQPATTLPTTAVPTTALPTTTSALLPKECLTASNLTDSWRLDHNGSDIRGGGPNANPDGYACDRRDSLQWFRFTGAAGNRMLNTCPKEYSCGTIIPFWTDGDMPQSVGVSSTINVYRVYDSNCKSLTRQVQVMRCSLTTPHDLIYNYKITGGGYVSGSGTCWSAFCGMI